ncbi:MAG: aminotransferase [Candidatus Parcubacteria bacterium]|nr:MAG: aminotransferase [Candidatus Parcubacteria bacterium]
MKKPINIDLVPNFEYDDFEIIDKLLKNYSFDFENLEEKAKKFLFTYFPNTEIYFFNSARSALSFLLENIDTRINTNVLKTQINASNIRRDPHILTQAFSCLVVPNAIKFAGFQPLYIDIDESFNLNIDDLKNKINETTKAIIIQNTFGIPAKIEEILNIAKKNNLLIIENLTHSLGAKYKGVYLGNFGDFVLLSFNRNKVISAITGGALIVRNKNFNEKIRQKYQELPDLDSKEIKKTLFTGKILYKAKENYNFLMKIYLKFLRTKNFTLEMVSSLEKQGKQPKNYLAKFPKILFPLLVNQLNKLERFNEQRKKIAQIYIAAGLKNFTINNDSEPIFLRFPIFSQNPDKVLEKFKKQNIYLGDWYRCVLAPCSNIENFAYKLGTCPKAENVSRKLLNLPTHPNINEQQAQTIINLLQKYNYI